jgi:prepilin-type processing-associated H-X9-DG protein
MVPARINGKPFYWGTCHVKQAGNIPVFSDCCGPNVSPSHWESPPESEGAMSNACPLMCAVAINRHNGGTNMLFLDWSLRKVGIKEHWTFKWSRQFDTAGVWTKAGGVLPEDWPKWMRGFRDY